MNSNVVNPQNSVNPNGTRPQLTPAQMQQLMLRQQQMMQARMQQAQANGTVQMQQQAAQNVQATKPQNSNTSINLEIETLKEKVDLAKNLPEDLREKLNGMIARLIKMTMQGGFSNEFEPVSEYISWCIKIPWGVYNKDNTDMEHAKKSLLEHHYGLEQVKQRVLEHLAVIHLRNMEEQASAANGDLSDDMKKLTGNSANAPVLCLVGIQGVGKTSIAKSIAIALERPFIRIALGGLGSVTELRGISRGMLNAEPGQVTKAIIRAGCMNPLILLDEMDKVSSDSGLRADVMAALLEILDPEQNATFMDKYMDYPLNLSKCMFICTANNLGGISAALLDRLEVIRFGSYNDKEKEVICRDYLLPKVRSAIGLTKEQFDFAPDVWPLVIRPFGFDAGVRQLERTLTDLARKVALQLVTGQTKSVVINKDNFRQYIPEDIGIYS